MINIFKKLADWWNKEYIYPPCEKKCPKCGLACLDDDECCTRSHHCKCCYYWNE